jgi:hypothetical protein
MRAYKARAKEASSREDEAPSALSSEDEIRRVQRREYKRVHENKRARECGVTQRWTPMSLMLDAETVSMLLENEGDDALQAIIVDERRKRKNEMRNSRRQAKRAASETLTKAPPANDRTPPVVADGPGAIERMDVEEESVGTAFAPDASDLAVLDGDDEDEPAVTSNTAKSFGESCEPVVAVGHGLGKEEESSGRDHHEETVASVVDVVLDPLNTTQNEDVPAASATAAETRQTRAAARLRAKDAQDVAARVSTRTGLAEDENYVVIKCPDDFRKKWGSGIALRLAQRVIDAHKAGVPQCRGMTSVGKDSTRRKATGGFGVRGKGRWNVGAYTYQRRDDVAELVVHFEEFLSDVAASARDSAPRIWEAVENVHARFMKERKDRLSGTPLSLSWSWLNALLTLIASVRRTGLRVIEHDDPHDLCASCCIFLSEDDVGSKTFTIGGEHVVLNAMDLLLFDSHVPHKSVSKGVKEGGVSITMFSSCKAFR